MKYVMRVHAPDFTEDAVDTYEDPDEVAEEVQGALEIASVDTIITVTVIE